MNAFARIIDRLAKAMAIISALATVTLMAALTGEVATRFAVGRSLPGMVELSETSLVVIVFFGFAYVALQESHIRMTLATNFAPGGLVRAMRLTAIALSVAFLAWLAYATAGRAITSFETGEYKFGLLQWPIWPARWAITIGLGVAAVATVILLLREIGLLSGSSRHADASDVSREDGHDGR